MNIDFLRQGKRLIAFSDTDVQRLRELAPLLEDRFAGLAETFYGRLRSEEVPRTFLSDPDRLRGLMHSLQDWARGLFREDFGENYLQRRARIGRIHVQINLPQRFVIWAMSIVRQHLVGAIRETGRQDPDWQREAVGALERALDLELAIMLETYQEDLLDKLRRSDRLATLGVIAGTVNHELKNPLGVVRTSLDAILRRVDQNEGLSTDERVRSHFEKIGRNLEKMQRQISSLLDYSRYTEPRRTNVPCTDLVQQAVADNPAPESVRLSVDVSPDLAPVYADREQMSQVLGNLLQNAYQVLEPGGGSVRITAEDLPEGIRFVVEDDGPGVPVEDRQRIFEPLWTNRRDGNGLGLAICRNLVLAHRGKIHVRDMGVRPGACFVVDLPVSGGAV